MRIAFDNQAFTMQSFGGVSRYFACMAEALSNCVGVSARVFAPFHVNEHLMGVGNVKAGMRLQQIPRTGRALRYLNFVLSAVPMGRFKPNLVHETYFSPSSIGCRGIPRVVTVHDMIHEIYSDLFPVRDPNSMWKKKAVSRADLVICVSQNTRKDLIEIFDVPEEKTCVIHLGFGLPPSYQARGCSSKIMADPYILFVGSRGGYKNFARLLEAYASSKFLNTNFKIVCFGGGGISNAEIALMRQLGIKSEQVQFISGGDGQLFSCYSAAEALVYPSLYEGFGIPPLEAMAVGCPVVCSNVSSIPEVVGNAGAYIDPKSCESIRSSLEVVLMDSEYRSKLVNEGYRRIRTFSWEACAKNTLKAYKKLN